MLRRVFSKTLTQFKYNQKPYHTALSLFTEDKVAKRQYDKEAIKVRMEPTPQPSQEDPELENYWLNLPTVFERAVGSERAELLDPTLFDDHLPEVVDIESGVGSSLFNPIIVASRGEPERVVGCLGDCWKANDIDYHTTDMQFWVMKENTFSVCDECGLIFYCASDEVMAQIEIWETLEEEKASQQLEPSVEYPQINA
ncbi:hypothetical protein FDP41_012282 [Naegleria fowleri]|uniref:Uncharacterized protein n=1 Tax=Naegleria fowleri TaxID=5763 RepID=A0A6A5C855_NAEFO|nr:uncharacterized protein FDP41_012282 [Naegleria fowleri]KAF0981625.1 hypothetical protein FDP41_012282 [Naegleria fowleri]CAG4716906.1 unnamed protein product [Naegleria fowleri]